MNLLKKIYIVVKSNNNSNNKSNESDEIIQVQLAVETEFMHHSLTCATFCSDIRLPGVIHFDSIYRYYCVI